MKYLVALFACVCGASAQKWADPPIITASNELYGSKSAVTTSIDGKTAIEPRVKRGMPLATAYLFATQESKARMYTEKDDASYQGIQNPGYSVLLGGRNTQVQRTLSVAVGGSNNKALGARSTVVGGFFNIAQNQATLGTIIGGSNNRVFEPHTLAMGTLAWAKKAYSAALGFQKAKGQKQRCETTKEQQIKICTKVLNIQAKQITIGGKCCGDNCPKNSKYFDAIEDCVADAILTNSNEGLQAWFDKITEDTNSLVSQMTKINLDIKSLNNAENFPPTYPGYDRNAVYRIHNRYRDMMCGLRWNNGRGKLWPIGNNNRVIDAKFYYNGCGIVKGVREIALEGDEKARCEKLIHLCLGKYDSSGSVKQTNENRHSVSWWDGDDSFTPPKIGRRNLRMA